MDQDDGVRRGFAVGVSVNATNKAGAMRLILDDLELATNAPVVWKQWAFFTFIDLPADRVRNHDLTDREYAAIGKAVLARLVALQALSNTE